MTRAGRRLGPLALSLAVVLVAGCSSSSGSSSGTPASASTTTAAGHVVARPTDTAPPGDAPNAIFAHGWPSQAGGTCAGSTPGKGGVLMTFCKGTASVTVTLADGPHTMRGVCWANGSQFEVDAGVTVGSTFTGPRPDYVTFQASLTVGSQSNPLVAWVGGTEYLTETASGNLSLPGAASGAAIPANAVSGGGASVTLSGNDFRTRTPVSVVVHCT